MFRRIAIALLGLAIAGQPVVAEGMLRLQPPPVKEAEAPSKPDSQTTKEVLTDAAIIALIIAGSIAIYKATGRPCACPSDTMRNGQACGNRSAWAKPGGARPLCFAKDITPAMIQAYRATKIIPAVW